MKTITEELSGFFDSAYEGGPISGTVISFIAAIFLAIVVGLAGLLTYGAYEGLAWSYRNVGAPEVHTIGTVTAKRYSPPYAYGCGKGGTSTCWEPEHYTISLTAGGHEFTGNFGRLGFDAVSDGKQVGVTYKALRDGSATLLSVDFTP